MGARVRRASVSDTLQRLRAALFVRGSAGPVEATFQNGGTAAVAGRRTPGLSAGTYTAPEPGPFCRSPARLRHRTTGIPVNRSLVFERTAAAVAHRLPDRLATRRLGVPSGSGGRGRTVHSSVISAWATCDGIPAPARPTQWSVHSNDISAWAPCDGIPAPPMPTQRSVHSSDISAGKRGRVHRAGVSRGTWRRGARGHCRAALQPALLMARPAEPWRRGRCGRG